MKLNYKQLQAYLSTCEAKLDVYNTDKCKAILNDSKGGEVATIDFENEVHECVNDIYIGEQKYTLTEVQMDLVLEYLDGQTKDGQQLWNEIKADKYDVRTDQGY